jgi:hypothetical protein
MTESGVPLQTVELVGRCASEGNVMVPVDERADLLRVSCSGIVGPSSEKAKGRRFKGTPKLDRSAERHLIRMSSLDRDPECDTSESTPKRHRASGILALRERLLEVCDDRVNGIVSELKWDVVVVGVRGVAGTDIHRSTSHDACGTHLNGSFSSPKKVEVLRDTG